MLSLLAQWDDIRVPREGGMEGRGQECAEGMGQVLSSVSELEQCVARVMGWTADERYARTYVSACPVPPRWQAFGESPTGHTHPQTLPQLGHGAEGLEEHVDSVPSPPPARTGWTAPASDG